MRKFSPFERQVVNRLYDSAVNNGLFLQNLLFEKLSGLNVNLKVDSGQIELVFPGIDPSRPPTNEVVSAIHGTQQLIVQIANLLSYLERTGLIIIVQTVVSVPSTESIQTTHSDGSKIFYELPDRDVNELFMRFLNKKIYTSFELDDIRNHRFVDRVQRHNRRQLTVAWIGISISLLLGVFSVYRSVATSLDHSTLQSIDSMKEAIQTSTVVLKDAIESIKPAAQDVEHKK
jgi:hypothetical protein